MTPIGLAGVWGIDQRRRIFVGEGWDEAVGGRGEGARGYNGKKQGFLPGEDR